MPKKTTLLIVILTVLTGALIYLAIKSDKTHLNQLSDSLKQKIQNTPAQKMVEKTTTVYFANSNLTVAPNTYTPQTVDLMVNSGKSSLTGVQVELSFDPQIIGNISVASPTDTDSFFGPSSDYFVLFKEVDLQAGKLTYAIAITPQTKAKQGVGKVGTLTFTLKNTTKLPTQIAFTSHTLTTQLDQNESTLRNAIPLSISVNTSANNTLQQ